MSPECKSKDLCFLLPTGVNTFSSVSIHSKLHQNPSQKLGMNAGRSGWLKMFVLQTIGRHAELDQLLWQLLPQMMVCMEL